MGRPHVIQEYSRYSGEYPLFLTKKFVYAMYPIYMSFKKRKITKLNKLLEFQSLLAPKYSAALLPSPSRLPVGLVKNERVISTRSFQTLKLFPPS